MVVKQKPDPAVVKVAARVLENPSSLTKADGQKMAARIMDDEKNAPDVHKPPSRAKQLLAKVTGVAKPKAALPSKAPAKNASAPALAKKPAAVPKKK